MAKTDNEQKLFNTEFNGFNKKQVIAYLDSLEQKYGATLKKLEENVNSLEVSYNELEASYIEIQDKYAELFDSYMALQEEKARIADVLIGAENRAAEIVEQARGEAEKERVSLEAQSESLREIIVDKNKILKDMKASASSMVSEFEADINARVQEICEVLNKNINMLNEKADIVIADVTEKNAEIDIAPVANDDANEADNVTSDEAVIVDDVAPAGESEPNVDGEVTAIFSDDNDTNNDGDFLL